MTASLELSRNAGGVSCRYSAGALTAALQRAGVTHGDIVMFHVAMDNLGPLDPVPEGGPYAGILSALRAAVGPDGTIVIPTYTFSFCRQEDFDAVATPTGGGPWSPTTGFLEYFRRQPGVIRSADPIHSVAAQGPRADALLRGIPPTCFGTGSTFHRLVEANALIVMIGLGLDEATIRHHSEEVAGVPFRFPKLFTGWVTENGARQRRGWVYSVRILADAGHPDGTRLEARALDAGVAVRVPLGDGALTAARAHPLHQLTLQLLDEDPWGTARGPAGDPVALERARVGGRMPTVQLPAGASMAQMIESLWALPRDIVSDGYDAALGALAGQLPMTIHEFPSGLHCWSWVIPEKWTCQEAHLETLDGRRLLSNADNPLHVLSYSLPFSGEVSREELLAHLHVHPRLPDAVPFMFKYYERDWGLCCSRNLRDTLTDDRYRVEIRSQSSFGTLKVGEVVVPGRSEETIVLCAHLCHPAMVNDDLTGVVVGMDVMRALLAGPTPRYTYRFLIVPETIGSVAFLSQHPELIPAMRGGLFLEMLGRDIPHALQLSFSGKAELDRCCVRALRARDSRGWTTPFRSLAGNDERQFNAPGLRVPMLSLTRQLPPSHADFPYREYHSSADTPDRVPPGALEESRDLVLAMIATLEENVTLVPRFAGEICCSRYGIHVDYVADPAGHKALFDVLFLIDGTHSVADIAELCGAPLDAVNRIVAQLRSHGLVVEDPCIR
jgi:aminopeptidase-like protein/aminoglycoside N3'-acetyltransferase